MTTMLEQKYTMTDWQAEDIAHLEQRAWSANWSEMGAYKTTTVQWLAERLLTGVDNPKVLVVTTKSGKGTYFQTVPSVLEDWNLLNIAGRKVTLLFDGHEFPVNDTLALDKKPTIVVTHYNFFTERKKKGSDKKHKNPILERVLKTEWDFVVLDEAHRIKERTTGWTRNIKKLKANYKHIMTGTGFINNPAEVWSLLNFLSPKTFSSYWRFREYFCHEVVDNGGFRRIVGINPGTKQEFKDLLFDIGVRRRKREVFTHLKEPIYTPVEVDLNPRQRKMYDEIKAYLQTLDKEGTPIYAPNVLAALQRLRQITVATPKVVREYWDEKEQRRRLEIKLEEPSSKLDALMEIIEGLEWDEDSKQQVVVFSNFRDPLELLKTRLDAQYDKNGKLLRAGIPYIHLEQKDNDSQRFYKWAELFPKKEHQVFMSTLTLGSESISLTPASIAIFLDRSWSPKDNEQAVARIDRPGQTDVPQIIHINARKTTDQRVEQVTRIKQGWFDEIFGVEEEQSGN